MITAEQVQNEVKFTTFSANSKKMKLSAQEQKSLFFGHYLFGKKNLKYCAWGVETLIYVAYGADYDIQRYTWQDIADMINNNWKAGNNGRWIER